MINIVLVYPERPNNTGNIGRLCVGMNAKLHLIKPDGFEITNKKLKRSGLDYWVHLDWQEYDTKEDWYTQIKDEERVFLFSSHASKNYSKINYKTGDWLVFGQESCGLSEEIKNRFKHKIHIPIAKEVRSFNLANSVAIALSEANRQLQND